MITTIAVCGAGTMGNGIAQVAAMAGYPTLLYDIDAGMLEKGRSAIEKGLAALREKDRLSPDRLAEVKALLSFSVDPGDCRAGLIIEAVVERPEVKLDLFLRLAAINSGETIFASNTSSLSLQTLAASIPGPQRFIGMHFFNPAPLMRLVEVVTTTHTDELVTKTVMQLARQMGKTPVLCRDSPGFIVNHVARPYYLEALHLLEKGIADMETIDALMEATGFRMGPFRLMDLIGNDINYSVSCLVYDAMGKPPRLKPSSIQQQQVLQGALGRKTGKGYYRYD
jgi:3-hydroxybutyryl-CoA dehydrogenase